MKAKPKKGKPAPAGKVCPVHRDYQGVYAPRVPCDGCWLIYAERLAVGKRRKGAS